MRRAMVILGILLIVSVLAAQESGSYQITDHTFNSGGHLQLTSPSYQITLTSVGDLAAQGGLTSGSFQMEGSFAAGYPPPSEVSNLTFVDPTTITWDAERSAGEYNLYRGALSSLASLGYGVCEQEHLVTATATDNDSVSAGGGYFYLVTVKNRLGEEGSKGLDSSDAIREGNVCP